MHRYTNIGSKFTAMIVLAFMGLITYVAGSTYMKMRNPEPHIDRVVPAIGFTQKKLSDYFNGLKDTPADTNVYIQQGEEEGGTALILGGTHANEPAAMLAAVVLLENCRISQGRMIIVPFANAMGHTHTYPQDGHPQDFNIQLPGGTSRTFRYGARITNPVHEWPNPDVYIHPVSGQAMAGIERSNLNRTHPGRADGSITERLAYGFIQLIKKEKVDIAIDMHEASPEYPVVNALVAHERAMELGAIVAMELENQGVKIRLEPSPKNLRGLSHREWGDNTDVLAFLLETANPSAGRFRGRTDEALILTGVDKAYAKAFTLDRLFIPYQDGAEPIEERVGRQITAVRELVGNLDLVKDGRGIEVEGIPSYDDLVNKGVGAFLKQ